MVKVRTGLGWLHVAIATFAITAAAAPAHSAPTERTRMIVLTDIGNEPDDSESLVRLLVYANEFDIEALVATTSTHQRDRIRPELIEERVRAYGEVVGNLRRHAPDYPDAALLFSRIKRGVTPYGLASADRSPVSEGARAIIAAVDRPDARPSWIGIWGGAADLAQALRVVRASRTPVQLARFVGRLRVYSISDQDDVGPYLRTAYPDLFWIASIYAFGQYPLATWSGISGVTPGADPAVVSNAWLAANVRSKGPLGALYPAWQFLMEGDTPSFLYLIPNGLGSSEHPDWGSWGGRYGSVSPTQGLWTDALDSTRGIDGTEVANNQTTIWRWRQAFQNDFAARMAWTVTSDTKAANHPPALVVNNVAGIEPVVIAACAGTPVTLTARGSRDPDGDMLALKWWWYCEASGRHPPTLRILKDSGEVAQVIVDPWRNGRATSVQFHVILEATDRGTPALTRYRRVVLTVPRDSEPCDAPNPVASPSR